MPAPLELPAALNKLPGSAMEVEFGNDYEHRPCDKFSASLQRRNERKVVEESLPRVKTRGTGSNTRIRTERRPASRRRRLQFFQRFDAHQHTSRGCVHFQGIGRDVQECGLCADPSCHPMEGRPCPESINPSATRAD